MSRPPRPHNKRATILLSDGKPRSVDEIAQELGVNSAEACEIIRSLMVSRSICVHETVTRYMLNDVGLRRSSAYKEADAAGPSLTKKRAMKAEYMRQKRAKEAEESERNERRSADSIVEQAMVSRHPLAMAWGREVAA